MDTQNHNQYIVAFTYLKPDKTWSKWYPLEDYVNVQEINGKRIVIQVAQFDLVTVNNHSLELNDYYQNHPKTRELHTEFLFMPARYDLKNQQVITVHEYDWSKHNAN